MRWGKVVRAAASFVLLTVFAPPPFAAAEPTLRNLRSVEELRTIFNEDRDVPRLVLLLSPT